jgi:hypothetical protein
VLRFIFVVVVETRSCDVVSVNRLVVQSACRCLLAYWYRFLLLLYWRLTPVLLVPISVGLSVLLLLSESCRLPRSLFFFFAYTPALPSRCSISSFSVNWLSYCTDGYISTVGSSCCSSWMAMMALSALVVCIANANGHVDSVGYVQFNVASLCCSRGTILSSISGGTPSLSIDRVNHCTGVYRSIEPINSICCWG